MSKLKRGYAIIGVYINNLVDINTRICMPCDKHSIIGNYSDGRLAYFDVIADGIYDYKYDYGYLYLDRWG